MTLPPLPKKSDSKLPYPSWALDIGAKLKEDQGGKYYEMEHTVVTKVYVYPSFRVEMPAGKSYVKKPYGYKNKTTSRKDNAVSAISVPKVKVDAKPISTKEEW